MCNLSFKYTDNSVCGFVCWLLFLLCVCDNNKKYYFESLPSRFRDHYFTHEMGGGGKGEEEGGERRGGVIACPSRPLMLCLIHLH